MRNRHQAIGLEIVDGSVRELEEQFIGRQHRIDREIAFESPLDDWALALIARGLGFALMPQQYRPSRCRIAAAR
jgi:hypothetical protein